MGEEKSSHSQALHHDRDHSFSFTLQPDLPAPTPSPRRSQAGQPCPVCGLGILDYDGLLNLVCPVCGFGEVGCFT